MLRTQAQAAASDLRLEPQRGSARVAGGPSCPPRPPLEPSTRAAPPARISGADLAMLGLREAVAPTGVAQQAAATDLRGGDGEHDGRRRRASSSRCPHPPPRGVPRPRPAPTARARALCRDRTSDAPPSLPAPCRGRYPDEVHYTLLHLPIPSTEEDSTTTHSLDRGYTTAALSSPGGVVEAGGDLGEKLSAKLQLCVCHRPCYQ